MAKKLLILGAKGLLGAELMKTFQQDKNYEVTGWDKEDVDISDVVRLKEKITAYKPEIVINATGFNGVDAAEEQEEIFEMAKMINGIVPGEMAKVAKQLGAVFVHYVSDYVFDGEKGTYNEDDLPNPISNYGISKALGEETIKENGEKYYLIRTSKLFGLPAKSEHAKKSFFEVMLTLAKNNNSLKVVDSERSCFTYGPDLALATKGLLEGNYPWGIYHIVNEGAVTWYEGLKKLFEILEIKDKELIPVSPEEFPRPAKRPVSAVLVNNKLPKLRNYEEALQDWVRDRRF